MNDRRGGSYFCADSMGESITYLMPVFVGHFIQFLQFRDIDL